jgi:hypothetical protein
MVLADLAPDDLKFFQAGDKSYGKEIQYNGVVMKVTKIEYQADKEQFLVFLKNLVTDTWFGTNNSKEWTIVKHKQASLHLLSENKRKRGRNIDNKLSASETESDHCDGPLSLWTDDPVVQKVATMWFADTALPENSELTHGKSLLSAADSLKLCKEHAASCKHIEWGPQAYHCMDNDMPGKGRVVFCNRDMFKQTNIAHLLGISTCVLLNNADAKGGG